jgi:hypothetical protein
VKTSNLTRNIMFSSGRFITSIPIS